MNSEVEVDDATLFEILVKAYNGDIKQALCNVCEEIEEIFGDEDFSQFIRAVVSKEFLERRQYFVN